MQSKYKSMKKKHLTFIINECNDKIKKKRFFNDDVRKNYMTH